MPNKNLFNFLKASFALGAVVLVLQPLVARADRPTLETGVSRSLPTLESPAVLKAPFSRVFTVGSVHMVKDRDYNPSAGKIQFSSLWIDAPEQNLTELAVHYCARGETAAGAQLQGISLHHREQAVAHIDRVITAEPAQFIEAYPGHMGGGFSPQSPSIGCSAGSARFDLAAMRTALASLPAHTLQVRLHFNNGATHNWHLGAGTVEAIKKLPKLDQSSAPAR
jgi:hypothetical protein